MTRCLVIICLLLTHSTFLAQSEEPKTFLSNAKYGFSIGVNQSLLTSNDLPDNVSLNNDLGIRLGLRGEFQLKGRFQFAPKIEISFNGSEAKHMQSDGSELVYAIAPVTLEFKPHFVCKLNEAKVTPYILLGPSLNIPLSPAQSGQLYIPTDTDVAIDVGIGFDRFLSHFNFVPELRYSYGLLDINQQAGFYPLYFHSVTLSLGFIG